MLNTKKSFKQVLYSVQCGFSNNVWINDDCRLLSWQSQKTTTTVHREHIKDRRRAIAQVDIVSSIKKAIPGSKYRDLRVMGFTARGKRAMTIR